MARFYDWAQSLTQMESDEAVLYVFYAAVLTVCVIVLFQRFVAWLGKPPHQMEGAPVRTA